MLFNTKPPHLPKMWMRLTIYSLYISGYRFNLQYPGSSCQSQSLATLYTTAPGRRNFTICSTSPGKIIKCTMSPKESKYLDHDGQWVGLDSEKRRAVKHGFSLDVLQLKVRFSNVLIIMAKQYNSL